jgi:hypothetical protein
VRRAGSRPAWYSLPSGGWRDYWTLLHPPYTLWHLSHVAIGAAAAPTLVPLHLGAALLAFFLGVGVAAHALDELQGRPLRTRIPDAVLWALGLIALAGAMALGVAGAARVSWWLVAFVAVGAFLVVAYNLELFGGTFHSAAWFALGWGAFPALTAGFAQEGVLTPAIVLVATFCGATSVVQQVLSKPVRMLRRRTDEVEGRIRLADGQELRLDEPTLRSVPERALRWLSLAMPLLAISLVLPRLT